jgi:hypothetical protein
MNRRDLLLNLGLAAASWPRVLEALASPSPSTSLPGDARSKIGVIADLVIPETETAGATGAGVVDFIDLMLGAWFSTAERRTFLDGVESLDAMSRTQCGNGFLAAGADEQTRLLAAMERRALQPDGTLDPASFVSRIKLLVLTGYYTSEVGASIEIDNTMIFQSFDGCIDLGPDDRAQSMTTPVPGSL